MTDRELHRVAGWPRSTAFKVLATRGDVHPGDAAEPLAFAAGAKSSAEIVLRQAAAPVWLPSIHESVVAWSITSNVVLAVVEQDCRRGRESLQLRTMSFLDERFREADWVGDELRLHFNYHPTSDADRVYEVLSGMRMRL